MYVIQIFRLRIVIWNIFLILIKLSDKKLTLIVNKLDKLAKD